MYDSYSRELEHFGIKGMKWGVRRYQNPDGTLTEAGKKRIAKTRERTPEEQAKHDARVAMAKSVAKTTAKVAAGVAVSALFGKVGSAALTATRGNEVINNLGTGVMDRIALSVLTANAVNNANGPRLPGSPSTKVSTGHVYSTLTETTKQLSTQGNQARLLESNYTNWGANQEYALALMEALRRK